MVNFNHRCIKNLSWFFAPLFHSQKEDGDKTSNKINWADETKTAFLISKNLIAQSNLL